MKTLVVGLCALLALVLTVSLVNINHVEADEKDSSDSVEGLKKDMTSLKDLIGELEKRLEEKGVDTKDLSKKLVDGILDNIDNSEHLRKLIPELLKNAGAEDKEPASQINRFQAMLHPDGESIFYFDSVEGNAWMISENGKSRKIKR